MAVRGVVMVLAIVVAAGCGTGEPAGDDAGSRGHRVQHLAFAGPAFAGRALVWGEEFRDGSLAVIRQRPGRRAQVVHRIATPSGRDRERSFLGLPGALSASSKWIVYGLDNAKVTVDGDLVVREPIRGPSERTAGARSASCSPAAGTPPTSRRPPRPMRSQSRRSADPAAASTPHVSG